MAPPRSSPVPPPRPSSSDPRSSRERLEALAQALQAAGIRSQVRIGIPQGEHGGAPLHGPASPADPASDLGTWLAPLRRRGALVEIMGPPSCGRTALAYRAAFEVSQQGGWIGWIDPADALDPRFAQRAGVPLERLLWVRPADLGAALRAAELVLKTGFSLVVLDLVQSDRGALARLGSAVWVRLQRTARRLRAAVVVLSSERPLAGAFATARLEIERTSSRFDRGLFEGYEVSALWTRDRASGADRGETRRFRLAHRP